MSEEQPNNPLHGITLKDLLEDLVATYGWQGLAERVPLRCFQQDPSVSSSLTFLRRTPWAREKVERLFLADQRQKAKKRERNRRRAERRAQAAQSEAEPDVPEPDGP